MQESIYICADMTAKRQSITTEASDEMHFLQHLEVLRKHLIRSVLFLFVFTTAAFFFKEFLFDSVILAPKNSDFITNKILCKISEFINAGNFCMGELDLKIVNLKLSGQFLIHLYISFFAGFIISAPLIFREFWAFVKPAMKSNEKRSSRGVVFFLSLLFLLGVLFSYYILVPLTLNFFGTYEVSESVENTISLSSYVSTVISVTLGVGIVFELPVIVFFLSKVGLLTPSFMKQKRKISIVLIMVVAAIITPADIFSMILVAVPLQFLYEISILISKRVEKKKRKLEAQLKNS